VQATYITDDTQQIAAEANERVIAATTELANEAARFRDVQLPPDLARKLMLLRLLLTLPAPSDPAERAELTRIASSLEADYGAGATAAARPRRARAAPLRRTTVSRSATSSA
jgi:peptidyl-dipeptidase A